MIDQPIILNIIDDYELKYKAVVFENSKLKARIKELEFQLAVQAKSITI
jgi:hypothetical protein